jgi:FtsP/CotA-like multicopper oxidase with cupredoxin domain
MRDREKKRIPDWRIILVLAVLFALLGTVPVSAARLDPLTIPKWQNVITGPPPVYVPVSPNYYEVNVTKFNQTILPPSMGLQTTVYGYGGLAKDGVTGKLIGFVRNSPGPTFEAVKGVPIKVKYINDLTEPHMFAVDPTLMWANPNKMATPSTPFVAFPPGYDAAQSPIPISVHLHGGEVQSTSDGGPDSWFTYDGKQGNEYFTADPTAANSAVFVYPNSQQPATIWYHDHALGMTRLNVVGGLAGFYLIRDKKTKWRIISRKASMRSRSPSRTGCSTMMAHSTSPSNRRIRVSTPTGDRSSSVTPSW